MIGQLSSVYFKFFNVTIHRFQTRSDRFNGKIGRSYVSKKEVDEAIDKWNMTESIMSASIRLKVSQPTMTKLLVDSGKLDPRTMKIGRNWRVPMSLSNEVFRQQNRLETISSAAGRIGVNVITMKRWLTKSGIVTRIGKNFLDPNEVNRAVLENKRHDHNKTRFDQRATG